MSPMDLAALRAAIDRSEYLRARLRRRMRRAQLAAVRCGAEGKPERARVWWARLLAANLTRRRLTNFEIIRCAQRSLAGDLFA
jgi:Lhr-like helicase